MIQKIAYLGNDLYQLDDNEIPIDGEELKHIARDISGMDDTKSEVFLDGVKTSGSGNLEVTANKGTIVNVYEVDYAAPADPNKETQQLGATVDEPRDFVTQYLFPGSSVEEVVVELRSKIDEEERHKKSAVKGWRNVLRQIEKVS